MSAFDVAVQRLRLPAALILAGHGLVHLMGVVALWGGAESGGLRAGDLHMSSGSWPAYLVGGLWLGVSVLFGVAAVLVASQVPAWRPVCGIAAGVSMALLATDARATVTGMVIDAAVLVTVALAGRGWHRPRPAT